MREEERESIYNEIKDYDIEAEAFDDTTSLSKFAENTVYNSALRVTHDDIYTEYGLISLDYIDIFQTQFLLQTNAVYSAFNLTEYIFKHQGVAFEYLVGDIKITADELIIDNPRDIFYNKRDILPSFTPLGVIKVIDQYGKLLNMKESLLSPEITDYLEDITDAYNSCNGMLSGSNSISKLFGVKLSRRTDVIIYNKKVYTSNYQLRSIIEDEDVRKQAYPFMYEDLLGNKITNKSEQEPTLPRSTVRTYIMTDSSGLYKIGKSIDPSKRHKTLSTGNPTIQLLSIKDSNIESLLHKAYDDKRVTGEWFKLSKEDVHYITSHYNFKTV